MTAYLIIEHKITDAAKFEEYRGKVRPMIAKHGGRILTKGGTHKRFHWDDATTNRRHKRRGVWVPTISRPTDYNRERQWPTPATTFRRTEYASTRRLSAFLMRIQELPNCGRNLIVLLKSILAAAPIMTMLWASGALLEKTWIYFSEENCKMAL